MPSLTRYILLGFAFGLLCAFLATVRQPVPITPWVLVATVYDRTLIGLALYLLEPWKERWGRWKVAFSAGFLITLALGLPWGIGALSFALIGGFIGLMVEWLAGL